MWVWPALKYADSFAAEREALIGCLWSTTNSAVPGESVLIISDSLSILAAEHQPRLRDARSIELQKVFSSACSALAEGGGCIEVQFVSRHDRVAGW